MRYITRIHLSNCGWREAYYPGTTIKLVDPSSGEPDHTVFCLENTGGKTSFLALLFSCFDTHERRFLKTLVHPNQKFSDYFGEVPAFIIVEWNLSSKQSSFLGESHLITGQLVAPIGGGNQREYIRRFFTFRSAPGLELEDIPAPGLRGFDEHGRLNGNQDVVNWLNNMKSTHPGNFQYFDKQSDWKKKLSEEQIDTDMLASQVNFNRSEGGIEEFLNFPNESKFLRKFLEVTIPEEEAEAVRGVIAGHVNKLSGLPQLEQSRTALRALMDKFAPFVEIASQWQNAQQVLRRRVTEASATKYALVEHAERAQLQAQALSADACVHESAAGQAKAEATSAHLALISAKVELARRTLHDAETLSDACKQEQDNALYRRDLLRAALSMRDILEKRERKGQLQNDIDAAQADLQPYRDELSKVGADFKATLDQRAKDLRDNQRSFEETEKQTRTEAGHAEKSGKEANKKATDARIEFSRIDEKLKQAQKALEQLENDHIIESGETAIAASKRHEENACSHEQEADDLRIKAESNEGDNRKLRESILALTATQSTLDKENEHRQEIIEKGENQHRILAFNETILKITGESEIDPDQEGVVRAIQASRKIYIAKIRDEERRQENIQADHKSIEETGLASIDKDVCAVVDLLRESGVTDAQPYAVYLEKIFNSADEVRMFAERDPARFTGVAVPTENKLAKARKVLQNHPPLSRPVVVAINDTTLAEDAPGVRFVIPVDNDAVYDGKAAQDLLKRFDSDLDSIKNENYKRQEHIEDIDAVLDELKIWKRDFGDGKLDRVRQKVKIMQDESDKIRLNIDEANERIVTNDAEAKAFRDQMREKDNLSNGCSENARRAVVYHRQWEAETSDWKAASISHIQSAEAYDRQAAEKEEEHRSLNEQVEKCQRLAREAADKAAGLEREATVIDYCRDGGQPRDDLDALHQVYNTRRETLLTLEKGNVAHLRGQIDEIQRGLDGAEQRYETEFSRLERSEVETEAKRDGLQNAAVEANRALNEATTKAAKADADANVAGETYNDEKKKGVEDTGLAECEWQDLRALEVVAIRSIISKAERTMAEQEDIRKKQSDLAKRKSEGAMLKDQESKEYQLLANNLGASLGSDLVSTEPSDLPRRDEVALLVNNSITAVTEAKKVLGEVSASIHSIYDEIRRFMKSDAFSKSGQEIMIAESLSNQDPCEAADNAKNTAKRIDDRLESIEHDIKNMDDDLQVCVLELERLLEIARQILRKMVTVGKIPDNVPRFGGLQVFRMSSDLSKVAAVQRKEILRNYVTNLADINKIPESGQEIAAELVECMNAALNRSSLNIRILKPKGEGETEYMPVNQVAVSGGELLTAAMMIYLVVARLRAEYMQERSASEVGVLILDNPLGKANKSLLLKTQIGLADAMKIQLFYTTGVQDLSALAEFENIVRLRRNRQSTGTGRIHVEVEAMQSHINKLTDGDMATAS